MKLILLSVLLATAACGPQTDANNDSSADTGKTSAITSETEPTSVELTKGAAKGTAIEIPPGSLAVGTDVNLAAVDSPSEFTVSSVEEASSAIEVSATSADGQAVTELASPMTIAIPFSGATNLMALAGVEKSEDNLCAFLKSSKGLFLWRRAALSIDSTTKKASFKSLNLGIFKLVYCGSEVIAGFQDASDAGVGTSGYSLKTTIDSKQYGFGLHHYCVLAFAEAKSNTNDKGATKILGSAQANIDGSKLNMTMTLAMDHMADDDEGLIVYSAQTAKQPCDNFVAGKELDPAAFSFERAFVFTYTKAELLAGEGSGELGIADLALKAVTVKVGIPANSTVKPAAVTAKNICLHAKGEGEFMEVAAAIDASGKINGASSIDLLIPSRANVDPTIEVQVAENCGPSAKGSSATTFEPYSLSFGSVPFGSSIFITPITLKVGSNYGNGAACLEVTPPNSSASRTAAFSLTIGESYSAFLPYLGTDPAPKYDMYLRLGSQCVDGQSSGTPLPLKGKTLTGNIVL